MFEDKHFSWDELCPRHVLVSEALEAELMKAIEDTPGNGLTGGKSKDKVKVKRRVVIDDLIHI